MTVLAIIPARGASKGIANKNIVPLGTKPLIAHTILAAKAAAGIDRLIVTTDSRAIADIASSHGAEIPFLRPADLARDDTPGIAPVLHAVNWLDENEGYRPDFVMLLQPTSPFRTAEDIDAVVELACDRQADGVVSVCESRYHPYWCKTITPEGKLKPFVEDSGNHACRQELPNAYMLNGAIYIVRRDVLLDKKTWYTNNTCAYIMPPERSLDIDTPWDLYLGRLIVEDLGQKSG